MFRAALRANRVARDEELRVGYVALGGGSLGRHAARHAKVHAVFGAQAGGSVERSGLSSVRQSMDPAERPRRQSLDPAKRRVRQSLDPAERPKRQRLDPANLGKVSFFNYRDRCARLVRPLRARAWKESVACYARSTYRLSCKREHIRHKATSSDVDNVNMASTVWPRAFARAHARGVVRRAGIGRSKIDAQRCCNLRTGHADRLHKLSRRCLIIAEICTAAGGPYPVAAGDK